MKIKFSIIILLFLPLFSCFAQNAPLANTAQEGDIEHIYIPKDLNDCFSELKKILPKEQIEEFKNSKEENAVSNAHMGLGRWIRNNWGLWAGNSRLAKYFKDKGVNHPDDMSGIILTSFHRYLNNKDIRLDKQVDVSRKWWKIAEQQEKIDKIMQNTLKTEEDEAHMFGLPIIPEKDFEKIDKQCFGSRRGIKTQSQNKYLIMFNEDANTFWLAKYNGDIGNVLITKIFGPAYLDQNREIKAVINSETKTITRGNLKYDAIEEDPKYKEIIKKAEEEAEKNINEPKRMGYCHIFWREKKRILKEKYGIEWKSPAELNPHIMFD